MMKFLAVFLFFFSVASANAEEARGACAQAKLIAEKAMDYILKHGDKAAKEAFTDPKGDFIYKDLYTFTYKDGELIIHGTIKGLVGTNRVKALSIKGVNLYDLTMAVKDRAWIEYMFQDPSNNDFITKKRSYIIHKDGYHIGAGCYLDDSQ